MGAQLIAVVVGIGWSIVLSIKSSPSAASRVEICFVGTPSLRWSRSLRLALLFVNEFVV